ncbi:pre-mRNA-splicing factor rse1 [Blastocladiella emersonii ATCC 22665]|nr:pre-mRNA-splicing factor rse1 [Blastocladiella emersonii ATCC 22665]
MHLYNLTLQHGSAVSQAVVGAFSGTKAQEIAFAKGTVLQLARVEVLADGAARVVPLLDQPVFGTIRSIASFRVVGGSKDYLIVGSDSGRIVILEYMPESNSLVRLHMETFGKSGMRRIVPGEYLATDPKGRAVMIGALEKQKFVYVLNRDAATRLTISSPLEAHKSHTLTLDLIGVDVEFDNPVFAALEVDYSEVDASAMSGETQPPYTDKYLTFYELDLGLNHVVRKWSEPVDPTSHKLIQIPGGKDGPSGVLVCAENCLTWRHMDHPEIKVPLPRRVNYLEDASRGLLVAAAVTHRLKGRFFVLLQSDEGDLYRLTMFLGEDGTVADMKIKYFDTVPVASSLLILKSGYLVVTAEFGNHHVYRIEDLGESDTDQHEYAASEVGDEMFVYFTPRDLRNLALVYEVDAPNPLMTAEVLNLSAEESPQIYALCGRGANSTFRTIRPGLELSEVAVTEVPGLPTGVWTTKLRTDDPFDAYIVVSFSNATVVFAVGETVEEVTDSGLLADAQTLCVQHMGVDDLVQVHPHGIRHVKGDKRTFEWKAPPGCPIERATANPHQLLIALQGGELVYFELDHNGLLNEHPERRTMPAPVTCLDIGAVPEGRLRNRYAAVGCADATVRVLCLDPDECLEPQSMQALNAAPESLCAVEMLDAGSATPGATATYLHIGLANGVMIRSTVDPASGELNDARLRFLGPRAPRLYRTQVGGSPALLALSSRSWLSYTYLGRAHMAAVQYDALDYAAGFATEVFPEALIAVARNTLRILVPDKLGAALTSQSTELTYTPRACCVHPVSRHFVVLEGDQNTYAPAEASQLLQEKANEFEDDSVIHYRDAFPEARFGQIKAHRGKWASCIRILNPVDGNTVQVVQLDPDVYALSAAVVQFASAPNDTFLVVGTTTGLVYPRTVAAANLHTYRFVDNGTRIEHVHATPVDDVPRALAAFHGRLVAGVGRMLRVYDLGKKRLLKKSENRQIPTLVMWIGVTGGRLVIGDQQESVHVATFRFQDNRIVVFADDVIPRWVTAVTMLDYDTFAAGDKFGNLFVLRLPRELSQEIDDDPTGNRVMYERSVLHGAAHKLVSVAEFFVGDAITSLHKAALVTGGREVLLYTTVGGAIACAIPLASKDDVEFFSQLEVQMRTAAESLVGRDHLRFRGTYKPVKAVTDGDLCEQFLSLPLDRKRDVAEELGRTVLEVTKRIEDLRARSAF